jgi:hypothetical protein
MRKTLYTTPNGRKLSLEEIEGIKTLIALSSLHSNTTMSYERKLCLSSQILEYLDFYLEKDMFTYDWELDEGMVSLTFKKGKEEVKIEGEVKRRGDVESPKGYGILFKKRRFLPPSMISLEDYKVMGVTRNLYVNIVEGRVAYAKGNDFVELRFIQDILEKKAEKGRVSLKIGMEGKIEETPEIIVTFSENMIKGGIETKNFSIPYYVLPLFVSEILLGIERAIISTEPTSVHFYINEKLKDSDEFLSYVKEKIKEKKEKLGRLLKDLKKDNAFVVGVEGNVNNIAKHITLYTPPITTLELKIETKQLKECLDNLFGDLLS